MFAKPGTLGEWSAFATWTKSVSGSSHAKMFAEGLFVWYFEIDDFNVKTKEFSYNSDSGFWEF